MKHNFYQPPSVGRFLIFGKKKRKPAPPPPAGIVPPNVNVTVPYTNPDGSIEHINPTNAVNLVLPIFARPDQIPGDQWHQDVMAEISMSDGRLPAEYGRLNAFSLAPRTITEVQDTLAVSENDSPNAYYKYFKAIGNFTAPMVAIFLNRNPDDFMVIQRHTGENVTAFFDKVRQRLNVSPNVSPGQLPPLVGDGEPPFRTEEIDPNTPVTSSSNVNKWLPWVAVGLAVLLLRGGSKKTIKVSGVKKPRKPKGATTVAATAEQIAGTPESTSEAAKAGASVSGKKQPGRKPKVATEVAATPAAPAVVAGKRPGRPPKAAVQVAAVPE